MSHTNREREISVKNLIFTLLYQWKKILAAAVVLAVALGGYQGTAQWQAAEDAAAVEAREQAYQENLEAYEAEKVRLENSVAALEADVQAQSDYLENAVLMQIDPHSFYRVELCYYLETDYQIMPEMFYQNPNNSSMIMASYQINLSSGAFISDVAEAVGMEPQYLSELVNVQVRGEQIFHVTISHNSYEEAVKIRDEIVARMDDLHRYLSDHVGEHTLSLVLDSVGAAADATISDTQIMAQKQLTEYEAALLLAQEELAALTPPGYTVVSRTSAAKTAVKWGLIGGVLGAVLAVVAVAVVYLFTDKVYSGEELRSRFGLKIMGSLRVNPKRQDPITRWLKRKEGRAVDARDGYLEIIAANICNYGENAGTLLVTGEVTGETVAEVAGRLQPKLGNRKLVACGSLLEDAAAVRMLPKCDGVLLVEECGVSASCRVAKAVDRITDAGKKIVGCITVE